ncbi:MAG: hypothetical protein Q8930_05210 [Bacillota bacterium]|nr:hypothetical protein [Bacillota bacterium]
MKYPIKVTTILLSIILLSGCGGGSGEKPVTNPPSQTTSEPGTGSSKNIDDNNIQSKNPVKVQDIKLVKKQQRAPYLIANDIISNPWGSVTFITDEGKVNVSPYQISGLSDKSLENNLNKAIMSDFESAAKNYAGVSKDTSTELYLYSENYLDYNNLYSLGLVRGEESPPIYGLLYRLTDGKKLKLGDLFTEGTDYVSLINRKVTERLAAAGEEDYLLEKPFSSIKPDQEFCLSKSSLYIIFNAGESGFVNRSSISIPLKDIGDFLDILDRSYDAKAGIYENSNRCIKYNNVIVNQKNTIIKKTNGTVWTSMPEISGMDDPAFEQQINDRIRDDVNEVLNSDFVNSLTKYPGDPDSPVAFINSNVYLNQYGILTIGRLTVSYPEKDNSRTYNSAYYTFDLKNRRVLDTIKLLTDYISKNSGSEKVFTDLVKKSLKDQYSAMVGRNISSEVDSKINYSFLTKNCTVYIQNYETIDNCFIYLLLPDNFIQGLSSPVICSVPFKSVVNLSLEEFLGTE